MFIYRTRHSPALFIPPDGINDNYESVVRAGQGSDKIGKWIVLK